VSEGLMSELREVNRVREIDEGRASRILPDVAPVRHYLRARARSEKESAFAPLAFIDKPRGA